MIPSYEIISSGSKGNAAVIDGKILIDCGVPFSMLEKHYKGLKAVLLTHIHGDHFKPSTIKRLAELRPALRFVCGGWLAAELLKCGVKKRQIDVLKPDELAKYKDFSVELFMLRHNMTNCGWKIYLNGSKVVANDNFNNSAYVSVKDGQYLVLNRCYVSE